MATSGTVIYARGNAGVYGTQSITGKTYDPANPVTFTTYPGDAIATFAGPATQPTTNTNGVYFVDITGLRIRHLKFNAAYGVSCLKVDSGIHVELDDVLVQDCGKSQVSTSTGGWIGAISVLVGGGASAPSKDFQVWNSRVFNWRDTENNPGHNHGFYFASVRGGGVFNTVIYNDVRGGGYGIQMGGSANDMTIANNTIDGLTGVTGGGGSGITVWLGDPTYYGAPATSGNLFVNNLFTNNVAYGVEGCGSVPVVQNVVRNNLTFSNALGAYRPAGCKTPANAGTFVLQAPSYSASPLYVDRAAKNFHLASDSPARGKSEPDYTPTHDADGIVRPAAPALGAFN